MSKNKIIFYNSHKPALQDGNYEVTVAQALVLNKEEDDTKLLRAQLLDFTVSGPKFDMDPSIIESVYPPAGGKGDYMADLPSLVLNRSTLPWERSPGGNDCEASWLFLLLIDEDETKWVNEKNGVSLRIPNNGDKTVSAIGNLLSVGEDDLSRLPSRINYIEVDSSKNKFHDFKKLIPTTLDELQYLSYARIQTNNEEPGTLTINGKVRGKGTNFKKYKKNDDLLLESGESITVSSIPDDTHMILTEAPSKSFSDKKFFLSSEEKAVILCNRLPRKGSNSTVYLVSVENNYKGDDFEGIIQDGKYILPFLYKWQFHTFDEELFCVNEVVIQKLAVADLSDTSFDFTSIKDTIYKNSEGFKKALKDLSITDAKDLKIIKALAKLPGSTFHELLHHLPAGFKPLNLNPLAKDIVITGTVKLPFNKIEKGEKGNLPFYTSAYYRSPFAACSIYKIDNHFPLILVKKEGSIPEHTIIPVHASQMILFDNENDLGEEDTSYAAAYELGRLTALNDVDFSTEFYKWKDETAKAKRIKYLKSIGGYKNILHLPLTDTPHANPIPKHVRDKFDSWKQLKGIPYRYLVPDPELLPNEGIRFFQVDNNWVNSFICGAFSIGHTVEADLSEELTKLFQNNIITGFLINSLVVKAWPHFEVDAYSTNQKPAEEDTLKLIRKDNLDASIQLRLYDGVTRQLNFHLHPGKMHSGFLFEDGNYLKANDDALENIEKNIPKGHVAATISNNNVIENISDLKESLGASTVSDFAAKMMEGTPTVAFTIKEY